MPLEDYFICKTIHLFPKFGIVFHIQNVREQVFILNYLNLIAGRQSRRLKTTLSELGLVLPDKFLLSSNISEV